MPKRRKRAARWGLIAALTLAGGAVAWLVTDSIVWFGVAVAFAVMFVVAGTGSEDPPA